MCCCGGCSSQRRVHTCHEVVSHTRLRHAAPLSSLWAVQDKGPYSVLRRSAWSPRAARKVAAREHPGLSQPVCVRGSPGSKVGTLRVGTLRVCRRGYLRYAAPWCDPINGNQTSNSPKARLTPKAWRRWWPRDASVSSIKQCSHAYMPTLADSAVLRMHVFRANTSCRRTGTAAARPVTDTTACFSKTMSCHQHTAHLSGAIAL